ncbi:MAG: hypothetical protein OXU20_38095 [Myxococcales bacterium]|nr:hypothetical protein [Myxococcales bacterium]MDD9970086.1 hypothetical protein [Myxococcales bacterium]
MPNIAGKAFAMNLITPIERWQAAFNKIQFWAIRQPILSFSLRGLVTLSMIHYARWAIVQPTEWPRLDESQPKEKLHYAYQLFFSNFNGSWAQYVDSFSVAIPSGLNLLWFRNVGWPKAVPEQPFHRYVEHNEVWTSHYYSAYPMAASNDVKSAQRVKQALTSFASRTKDMEAAAFEQAYNELLNELQADLSQMAPTPIVSLANAAVEERMRQDAEAGDEQDSGRAPAMMGGSHAE